MLFVLFMSPLLVPHGTMQVGGKPAILSLSDLCVSGFLETYP
jgi:hypothetical protein